MVATLTPLTLRLAVLLGLILVATGLGGWLRPGDWRRMLDEMAASPALTMALAMAAILFGLVVLLAHHHWRDPLAAIVTGIATLAFVEGLILLAVPNLYLALVRSLLGVPRVWAAVAIVGGALLILAGLTGTASFTPGVPHG